MEFKAGMIQFSKLIKDEKEISYFTNRHKNKLNYHLLTGFETRSTKKNIRSIRNILTKDTLTIFKIDSATFKRKRKISSTKSNEMRLWKPLKNKLNSELQTRHY
ncbi:hypothetical protein AABB24_032030 [Solanum stoloniferum]|uniref:Translocon at the inner envelope membrane of chloroplasts 214 n=1 Tax=Solanum stoloniferum TaxID=62892 RepID=A0ABD2RWQ4_9SOLN